MSCNGVTRSQGGGGEASSRRRSQPVLLTIRKSLPLWGFTCWVHPEHGLGGWKQQDRTTNKIRQGDREQIPLPLASQTVSRVGENRKEHSPLLSHRTHLKHCTSNKMSCYSTTQSKTHILHSSLHIKPSGYPHPCPWLHLRDKTHLLHLQTSQALHFARDLPTVRKHPSPSQPLRVWGDGCPSKPGAAGLPHPRWARQRYSPRKSIRLRARKQPASIALASSKTGEKGTGEGDGSRLRRERRRCGSGVGAGRNAPDLYEPAGEAGRRWPVMKPHLGLGQVPSPGLLASCPTAPGGLSRAQQCLPRVGWGWGERETEAAQAPSRPSAPGVMPRERARGCPPARLPKGFGRNGGPGQTQHCLSHLSGGCYPHTLILASITANSTQVPPKQSRQGAKAHSWLHSLNTAAFSPPSVHHCKA